MAFIFSGGKKVVVSRPKKTFQGDSQNTKYCKRGNRPRRKKYRGQGRG